MNVKRWVFYDPHTAESWTVPINPAEMTSPFPERNIQVQTTTALNGQALFFEGATPPANWQFSGKILHRNHHETLLAWSRRKGRIRITDHYGRVINCILVKFDPVPTRSRKKWKHDYTMTALVIGQPSEPTEGD